MRAARFKNYLRHGQVWEAADGRVIRIISLKADESGRWLCENVNTKRRLLMSADTVKAEFEKHLQHSGKQA